MLFMCVCSLLAMNSLYTTFAATRLLRWEMDMSCRNSFKNSSLYPSMNRLWFEPNSSICRRCASDVMWHLNPFWSRHCFAHTWQ